MLDKIIVSREVFRCNSFLKINNLRFFDHFSSIFSIIFGSCPVFFLTADITDSHLTAGLVFEVMKELTGHRGETEWKILWLNP